VEIGIIFNIYERDWKEFIGFFCFLARPLQAQIGLPKLCPIYSAEPRSYK
jgi:hypothetical protein